MRCVKSGPTSPFTSAATRASGLPRMYEICEENGLTYTFGFSTNPRLKKLTEGLMNQAVEQYAQIQREAAAV